MRFNAKHNIKPNANVIISSMRTHVSTSACVRFNVIVFINIGATISITDTIVYNIEIGNVIPNVVIHSEDITSLFHSNTVSNTSITI